MRRIVVGILAHVDAGKTTLSEGMLYLSGRIQRLGRVDKGDAYLDTHDLERERGITIFPSRPSLSSPIRSLPCWTPRGTSIFPRRWKGRCRFWTARYW